MLAAGVRLRVWWEEAGAEHLGADLDQAWVILSADHQVAGTGDFTDSVLRRAFGSQPDDVRRRGDGDPAGVLEQQLIGTNLRSVRRRFRYAHADRCASRLNVGNADAVVVLSSPKIAR